MALVAFIDDDTGRGGAEIGWFAANELVPVRADPNTATVIHERSSLDRSMIRLDDLGNY